MLHPPSTLCRVAFAVALLASVAAAPPASADELQDAIAAVKRASDADLLDELQRRSEGPGTAPKGEPGAPTSRNLSTELSALKDEPFLKAANAELSSRGIYGPDDRVDWHLIPDNVKRLAGASVALFRSSSLRDNGNGSYDIETSTLGASKQLCPGETFEQQRVGAYCSGVLITPDRVLTAGHCVGDITRIVNAPYIQAIRFVFGFYADEEEPNGRNRIASERVFKGKSVLGGTYTGNGADWALVTLDRAVPSEIAKPVTSWATAEIATEQEIFVIGYPSGLPLKYAPGSKVVDAAPAHHFSANLDTFGGNSGSPVFDKDTHALVGVLVRGAADYLPRDVRPGECRQTSICPDTPGGRYCEGEHVTRISVVPRQ